jgi:hypothetical protein
MGAVKPMQQFQKEAYILNPEVPNAQATELSRVANVCPSD